MMATITAWGGRAIAKCQAGKGQLRREFVLVVSRNGRVVRLLTRYTDPPTNYVTVEQRVPEDKQSPEGLIEMIKALGYTPE